MRLCKVKSTPSSAYESSVYCVVTLKQTVLSSEFTCNLAIVLRLKFSWSLYFQLHSFIHSLGVGNIMVSKSDKIAFLVVLISRIRADILPWPPQAWYCSETKLFLALKKAQLSGFFRNPSKPDCYIPACFSCSFLPFRLSSSHPSRPYSPSHTRKYLISKPLCFWWLCFLSLIFWCLGAVQMRHQAYLICWPPLTWLGGKYGQSYPGGDGTENPSSLGCVISPKGLQTWVSG